MSIKELVCGWRLSFLGVMLIAFTVGCGDSTPQGSSEKESSSKQSQIQTEGPKDSIAGQASLANQAAAEDQGKQLVGFWLGLGFIDEIQLEKTLQSMDDAAREEALQKAEYFYGTTMAIRFADDGSMENQIEIMPPNGVANVASAKGTWKIVQTEDRRFVLQLNERQSDGTFVSSEKQCQFYEDGNHMAIKVPLDGQLGSCNPLLIFERQSEDKMADGSAINRNQIK